MKNRLFMDTANHNEERTILSDKLGTFSFSWNTAMESEKRYNSIVTRRKFVGIRQTLRYNQFMERNECLRD